jgi:hypothetical protein
MLANKGLHLPSIEKRKDKLQTATPEAGSKIQTIEATFDASSILNLKFRTNIQKIHFELIRNIFFQLHLL